MPPSALATPPVKKRRWRRVAGFAALALLIALAIALLSVYRATRHVPQFYEEALAADPVVQRTAGDELERVALDLHNDVKQAGAWEALFTEEQVNGWLAVDLVEKFPNLLPTQVSAPRVAISAEEVKVACRYTSERFDVVISLGLAVSMTEEPNVIAVRVLRARAGSLPIPLNQFLDDITKAAHEGGLDLRWQQSDGDPVALIRLPTENTELPDRRLHLEKFELRAHEAFLSGRTEWKEKE
jgi:hypothetical protein